MREGGRDKIIKTNGIRKMRKKEIGGQIVIQDCDVVKGKCKELTDEVALLTVRRFTVMGIE